MAIVTCRRCGKVFEAPTRRRRFCAGECFCANEREQSRARRATYSPARKRAMLLVQSAIYHGTLIRQPCELCGKQAEAHHDDYSKPLEVRWLCRSHHRQHHVRFGKAKAA